MKISCPDCGFSKVLPQNSIPKEATTVRCPKCRQQFPVPRAGERAPEQTAVKVRSAEPTNRQPLQRDLLDIPKAGFWMRVVATLIDSTLVTLLQFVLGLLLGIAGTLGAGSFDSQLAVVIQLFGVVLGVVYYVVFTGHGEQTPGKMALRIKVIRCDGSDIGYARAALREIPAKFISTVLLCIGYLMVAFDDKKQGLHDRMADTYVVKL